ncbi:DUF72 domain-containing protein [Mucilaginibacter aquaedulcis]|uniref:DUF72 domain-containing protein n=1 Tax=Mucilaginibacter aquaedulcis TaxID=1187081 RepID=UPI0025B4741D|nr:DUF72 domain-containing protein [Mucilaginibacter aquaedulcis]MDN3548172.1 DUF72 domain-containing protein [Mucilaginibacter aquaedulcis]
MKTDDFFGGMSGLVISIPKRDFPKEFSGLSRLGFYGFQENSIEINSSFYKLPKRSTIQRWVSEVPENFRFTFKLWKEITHQKNLLFNAEHLRNFMQVIDLPTSGRGCLLVQFPPALQVSALPQLTELIKLLADYGWRIAVEFRHASWYADPVYDLLSCNKIAMVIQDMPKSATPLEITAEDLMYLRFHGPAGNYRGSYDDDFLAEYATIIREWQDEGKTVYCYFNNTSGAALQNLHFLKRCLIDIRI